MILPPGFRGAAFTTALEGDVRADPAARARTAERLGIPGEWALARQVHGTRVVWAEGPGLVGEGDALATSARRLPVSVAAADCVPLVLEAEGAVGVVHAGWRGLAAGVIETLRREMAEAGHPAERAAVGPSIGPCCFEVGPEVARLFETRTTRTGWDSVAVDLWGVARDALAGLRVWEARRCTRCDPSFFSYRRDGTGGRQVAVAWVP